MFGYQSRFYLNQSLTFTNSGEGCKAIVERVPKLPTLVCREDNGSGGPDYEGEEHDNHYKVVL